MALNLHSLVKLLSLICSILTTIIPVMGLNYPAIFNFGDSNSDTGGLVAGKAFHLIPPNGETYFLRPSGRLCDVDQYRLACCRDVFNSNTSTYAGNDKTFCFCSAVEAWELPYLNPYLDSVGSPSFKTGCNFATGGSTITPASADAISPFSFNRQLSQFFRFKKKALSLLKDKELQEYLPAEDYFKQGLYMFDIGQNDIDGAFNFLKSEEKVISWIPNLLSTLKYEMKRLYDDGARNFWIHNTGPLGCLPRIIATHGKNASNLDELGCVLSHNRAANAFNQKLHDDVYVNFLAQLPEVDCTYVDIYSIKLNLISNHSLYGLQQPLAACCGYGGPPLNFDTRIACGMTKDLNGSKVTANACNNAAEYINWDGTHYTEAANRLVADLILTGNYSVSPSPHLGITTSSLV